MTENLCELVKAFAAEPRRLADTIRPRVEEVLGHADNCDACEAALDAATDSEGVFAVLADEEALLSPDDRRALDRWTAPDTNRKEEIDRAVKELIGGLRGEAAKIAAGFEPGMIYATTEAVSLAIRRCVDRGQVDPWITLSASGVVAVDFKEVIAQGGLAGEIAAYIDLWRNRDAPAAERRPSDDAYRLAHWTFLALRDQRNLLRHFRVMPMFGLSFASDDHVTLMQLRREERIDNLYQRWRPDPFVHCLYIGRWTSTPAGGRRREIFVVDVGDVTGRLRAPSIARRLRELGLGEDAEVFVGPKEALPVERVMMVDSLQVRSLGEFEEIRFSGVGVELVRNLAMTTLRGERVMWRWDRV